MKINRPALAAIAVPAIPVVMALGIGAAYVNPFTANAAPTVTVDGSDYPVCAEEDCSDQPNQVGVWFNNGKAWLSVGDHSLPINDYRPIIGSAATIGLENVR